MVKTVNPALLEEVAAYYAEKLRQHGQTPQGVDWNNAAGQWLRFHQLAQLFDGNQHFSVNDLGCGYGAFYDFISQHYPLAAYIGIDICETMTEAAQQRHAGQAQARFICAASPDQTADYTVTSGIFNVRFGRTDPEWQAYLETTLDSLDRSSRRGFAFNCLTRYADADKMKANLYYADPCQLFDLCKRKYSRNVTLLHDYDLYEFTLLVRKS